VNRKSERNGDRCKQSWRCRLYGGRQKKKWIDDDLWWVCKGCGDRREHIQSVEDHMAEFLEFYLAENPHIKSMVMPDGEVIEFPTIAQLRQRKIRVVQ